jgi:sortase A
MLDRLAKLLQTALSLVATVMLIYWGLTVYERTQYQTQAQLALDNAVQNAVQAGDQKSGDQKPPSQATQDWLGRLQIPRFDLSVMVREGDDNEALELGVGHIPGTALPGGPGNAALAGHRDTFFRALRGVQPGDEIRWTSIQESATYLVESTRIVEPSETDVLGPSKEPRLTLVTCYPFGYIGPAPKRFIVQARLMETSAKGN